MRVGARSLMNMAKMSIKNENARAVAVGYLQAGEWAVDKGLNAFERYKASQKQDKTKMN